MPQASKEASRDSHPSRPGWRQDPAGNPGREKGARGRESQGKHACCATRRARMDVRWHSSCRRGGEARTRAPRNPMVFGGCRADCCALLLLQCSRFARAAEMTSVGVLPSGAQQDVLHNTQVAALPWLLIGIPTVPRPNGADYLTATLSLMVDALSDEPTDPMSGQVRCMVVNQRPGGHPTFEQLRRQHAASTALLFVDRPADTAEAAEAAAAAATAAMRPPLSDAQRERQSRVRQHTRDVVAMLRLAHHRSRLFLFMEVRGCSPVRVCTLQLYAPKLQPYVPFSCRTTSGCVRSRCSRCSTLCAR